MKITLSALLITVSGLLIVMSLEVRRLRKHNQIEKENYKIRGRQIYEEQNLKWHLKNNVWMDWRYIDSAYKVESLRDTLFN